MIDKTFRLGNYNEFEEFINNLSNKNKIVKTEIVKQLDEVLVSMVGENSKIQKREINTTWILKDNNIEGFYLNLLYNINVWNVPNCPERSRLKDEQSLKEAITRRDSSLEELSIDTNTGNLTIKYRVNV